MTTRRWTLAALLVLAVALALGWRTLLAAAWLNAGGLYLDRALLAGDDSDGVARAGACFRQVLAWQPDNVRAERQLVRLARAQSVDPATLGIAPSQLTASVDPLTLFHWGFISLDRGYRAAAIATWRRVPTAERFFMNAGMVDYAAGHVTQALEAYALSDAIDDTPSLRKKWMYADLCAAYSMRGPLDEGVQWCERAAQVEDSVWNLIYLGRAYLRNDELDQALAVLLRARHMRPSAPSSAYYLGLTYGALGQWSAAQEALLQGVRLNPDSATMNLALAEASARRGDAATAYCAYQRAIRYAETAEQAGQARAAQNALALSTVPPCEDLP